MMWLHTNVPAELETSAEIPASRIAFTIRLIGAVKNKQLHLQFEWFHQLVVD